MIQKVFGEEYNYEGLADFKSQDILDILVSDILVIVYDLWLVLIHAIESWCGTCMACHMKSMDCMPTTEESFVSEPQRTENPPQPK